MPPRGSQEAPKKPPRGPKSPPKRCPEAPKRPHLHYGNLLFMWKGLHSLFVTPSCVQYVAVRPPPGPRSAGLNPPPPSPLCRITARRARLNYIAYSCGAKDGFAHSADPFEVKSHTGLSWPQLGLKMAQVASKLPLTCHLASDVAGKLPQDASEEGFWPSRCHLGLILVPSWGAK